MRLLKTVSGWTLAIVVAITYGMMSSCGDDKCEKCGSDIDKCTAGCACTDCSSACSCNTPEAEEGEHEKATPVESMKVYIDASGSMEGYFDKGSGEGFITAVTKLANYGKGNNPVFFFGSKNAISVSPAKGKGLAGELKAKHKNGHSSFFYIVFDTCADEIGRGDEDIICFVTDGIIGASNKQTESVPEYIKKNINAVKDNISKVFKDHPDVKVSVYKLSSTYVGSWYYDYRNVRKNSFKGIIERPFYVIAMGKADKLRQFREDNGLEAQDELHFGLHETDWHNSFRLYDLKHFDANGKWIEGTVNESCDLVMTLPKCMHSNYAFIKENAFLSLDKGDSKVEIGKEYISIGSDGVVHINKYNIENNPEILPDNKYSFRFSIKSPRDPKWDSYSCDDDRNIDKDALKQAQTFYLRYLLDGIHEGVGETILMDISYEFER